MPAAATAVIKASAQQRYTLGLAYPADRIDAHTEYMTAPELEAAAWEYVAKHRDVGLYHAEGTLGHGVVVESYIYRGPDWTLPNAVDGREVVIKAGDWLMGVQWDVPAWSLIEKGLAGIPGGIDGLSMQGRAIRVPTPDAALAAA
jgi:hypothetical protein